MPITQRSFEPLSRMTQLKQLMIPMALKPESEPLKKMLPHCKVAFTTYSIEF
jgi:hypothetical protein